MTNYKPIEETKNRKIYVCIYLYTHTHTHTHSPAMFNWLIEKGTFLSQSCSALVCALLQKITAHHGAVTSLQDYVLVNKIKHS